MKLFEIPMVVTSLLGFGLLSGLDAPPARADFTFGEPVNLTSVIPVLDPAHEAPESMSADGLEMYIESDRSGGSGKWDLWVCKRASIKDDWCPPENLGPLINSASMDEAVCISADGLELYFNSDRPGGYGSFDCYVARRATRTSPWGPATNLGPKINTSALDGTPCVSSDGLELYFISGRPGGYGGWGELYVSKRATKNDPWGDPVNLGPVVNSPYNDWDARLSPDDLLMFFESNRPGGYGNNDIWMTRRASRSDPWQSPVNLGPVVNGTTRDGVPFVAPDGSALYFSRGDATNWKAPITPIVDFDGDGNVDLVDLVLLIDAWGTDNTLYDIGPFAWGDGKVDIEDLKVFIAEWEKWEKQNPPEVDEGQ